MSTRRTPDELRADRLADERIFQVLEQVTDDFAMWWVTELTDLDPAVCEMWLDQVYNHLRAALPAEDMLRAVLLLLSALSRQRADDLLFTVRGADPDDLLDGPWSL